MRLFAALPHLFAAVTVLVGRRSPCPCCYCDDEVDEDDIEETLKELS